jgi:hypothetical protein
VTVDPDQDAALRRLRAAFGFVEVLEVIDHDRAQPGPPPEDVAEEDRPPEPDPAISW